MAFAPQVEKRVGVWSSPVVRITKAVSLVWPLLMMPRSFVTELPMGYVYRGEQSRLGRRAEQHRLKRRESLKEKRLSLRAAERRFYRSHSLRSKVASPMRGAA